MIPVCHSVLAPYEGIIPYLEEIDRNQIYGNDGPLLLEFEKRLCQQFDLNTGDLLCVANGTVAIQIALLALVKDTNSLCLMPSWTFTASPAAAISAGLTPYFVDVDTETWALTPEIAEAALKNCPGKVGCVMVVSPFGYPIPTKEWDKFTEKTGVPVVVDGAGMFVEIECANTPLVVSLHTTKCFGMGEGGFIASRDQGLMKEIASRRNFGMMGLERLSYFVGTNAKLSEYSAAVGLAQLDYWPTKYAILIEKAKLYKQLLDQIQGVRLLPGYGENWFGGNLIIEFEKPIAKEAAEFLHKNNIETKFWWRQGCHKQEAYKTFGSDPLPNTKILAASTLGIPFSVTLSNEDIGYVCKMLEQFLDVR